MPHPTGAADIEGASAQEEAMVKAMRVVDAKLSDGRSRIETRPSG
jgi:hypothetical protein